MAQEMTGGPVPPSVRDATALTQMSQVKSACHVAGFLVREDREAIYIADMEGTWMLPSDSYESLTEWPGGVAAPDHLRGMGRPVHAVLKEGATIYEIRPWRIRQGGDPFVARQRRELIQHIFSLEAGSLPTTERTVIGESLLAKLEEAFGRRLGWAWDMDINDQSFFAHHLRSASWKCESDGGGS